MNVVLLAIAGGVGALTRAEWTRLARARWPEAAWGTRAVNLVGATALAALLAGGLEGEAARIMGLGFLGGFTTFSTWMLDADDRGTAGGRASEIAIALLPAVAIATALTAMS